MNVLRTLTLVAVLGCASSVFAQGMLNYVDPSASSSRRGRASDSNKTATGTNGNANAKATPKPSPSPTPKSGMSSSKSTSSKSTSTTGSKSMQPSSTQAKGAKPASGGGGGFSQTGQLKEVTKAMVESIRTRKVDFDEEEAAKDPAIIMLNPRKLTPADEQGAKTDSLARPL